MPLGIYPNSRRVKRGRDKKEPTMFLRFKGKYKINANNQCWEWFAAKDTGGYGIIGDEKNRFVLAHRYSYTIFIGEIPKGLLVCHKCDNRKCVNPFHFFLGTHKDNNDDCIKKGRANRNRKNKII